MMEQMSNRSAYGAIALAVIALMGTTAPLSRAEAGGPEAVGLVQVACPMTGPGIAACAATGVVLEEVVQALNGKEAFGPNGELMSILAAPVQMVAGNVKGSERESGELAKLLRASTGVSVRDINDYGLWGGPNSLFRKPLG